ncbi:MAG TPA: YdaS family helix-turn-helix protein [Noviherbaspirillum sp.]|nr:YdaS family helix-turn-helix protein [Noviherbaspirillum sp.]
METGINRAVQLAGSQTALANRLGVTPQAVQKWVEQGYAPAERCRAIESEFDGAVTRYDLNPTVFGEAPIGDVKYGRRVGDKESP